MAFWLCVLWKEKIKMEFVLEKMCENLVDVIHEMFTRKYYVVKISQSKKGHIYLIVRKKRDWFLYEQKVVLHGKIFDIASSVFTWYCKRHKQLEKNYFLNLKLIKECSGHHFQYFFIFSDRYVNENYWWNLFLSARSWVFL